jgi:hypothetical protein
MSDHRNRSAGAADPWSGVNIGVMFLSPVMMPIIGLEFRIATLDFDEFRRTGIALLSGSLPAVTLPVLLMTISPNSTRELTASDPHACVREHFS